MAEVDVEPELLYEALARRIGELEAQVIGLRLALARAGQIIDGDGQGADGAGDR